MRWTFSLIYSILTALISVTVNAAPLKFFVATEYGIDQETGQKGPIILNRSGEVDLKFFDGGIELHFENSKQNNSMYRIHLDFEGLLEAPMESRKKRCRNSRQYSAKRPSSDGHNFASNF